MDSTIQSKKAQSIETITLNHKMKLEITIAKLLRGGGKRSADQTNQSSKLARSSRDLEEYCDNNRYVTVLSKDRFCLVRAIIIAKAHYDKEKNAKNLKRDRIRLNKRVQEQTVVTVFSSMMFKM